MNAVSVKELSKVFRSGKGEVRAVDGVSFDIPENGIYGLLGVNGAGKTTIIRMLCGLLVPTSGSAEILGKPLSSLSEVKREIAVSPQETSVAPNLTVRENLVFIARVYGAGTAEAKARAAELIDELKLGEVADRRAKTLSGGWQRRLSIAIALVSKPRILFLDEPTLGLDVLARRELWGVIENVKKSCTIVLTTHYLEEAERLCDNIAVLVSGKLVAAGTADELKALAGEEDFEEAFVKLVEGKK